jgi:PBSX family phage terminase large subunit
MNLHKAQKTIAVDTHRFRVLRCGRRFGKSLLIAEEIKGVAISKPNRIAYIANNYGQARDIMWELLKKELLGATIDTNEQRLEIKTSTIKGGESLIVLRGWESVENLRGQSFDFLAIDEVAMMRNFWTNWYEVLRPTLTDRRGSGIFASTPKGYNHFFDLCNEELKDKDFKTFHFSSYDNPHLPKDEIDKAKETLPSERFSQEYEATFQKTSGLVYKEFNREKHLYDVLPEREFQKIGGVDFGYRNPAAVLDVRTNGEIFYVEDEWYKTERTDAQIAEYVASCHFQSVYPDPENPGAIEELRKRGVNTREVNKGKDSIKMGIQRIRELFLQGKLLINRKCVNLISELETYSYDEDQSEQNPKENPIKFKDHALDSLRYIIMSKIDQTTLSREELARRYQAKQRNVQNFAR